MCPVFLRTKPSRPCGDLFIELRPTRLGITPIADLPYGPSIPQTEDVSILRRFPRFGKQ